MNRSEKQQLIDELHAELKKSPNAVLLDFKGLSVPAATEFRRKVRASGSRYRVVKNSLALRAAKGTALERLEAKLEGTTGIAYTGDDPVALAKAIDGGQTHYSPMPGLPELRAKLLGLLMGPAQQLVSLLNEPATQTVRVLKAHGDKLEGGQ